MIDIRQLIRKNIVSLQPYSSARSEFSGEEGVFLDANENPYGTLNRYPDPLQKKLKQQLSLLKEVPADNIFIGNGSDEVIDLTFRIFCNPGVDKALTFVPTYGMYEVSANINDIEMICLPLNEEFQINTSLLEAYLDDKNLKLIFICSPNNPTGNAMNTENIEFILKRFNGIVFIDEAYSDFCPSLSWITKLRQYPNLIISQTFSKAWGLAAARVGIAYADKSIIEVLNKVKPPYNVSQLNQEAALTAIQNRALFEQNKRLILQERKFLIENLKTIPFVKRIHPSEANFLLVEVIDATGVYDRLVAQKVIVRNRHSVIRNNLRITVGSPEENQTLLNALKNIE